MLAVAMSQPVSHFGPVHKRPKLSLQTSELPISYSCASQGLATNIQSISTVTPTTLNTFNNAYDLSIRPSPTSAIETVKTVYPSRSQSPRPSRRSDRPYVLNLPYGVKSILKNSSLRNNSISASPCTSTRKVFFPQPKRVGFRRDLEEDIVTNVYTARHSDLLVQAEDENVVESIENGEPQEANEEEPESPAADEGATCLTKTETSISISSSEVTNTNSTSLTSTPTSRKRRRWEWTLAPVVQEEQVSDDVDEVDVEEESDWVIVSVEESTSETWQTDLESMSKKRRATSLDIDHDVELEPVRKLVKAASW